MTKPMQVELADTHNDVVWTDGLSSYYVPMFSSSELLCTCSCQWSHLRDAQTVVNLISTASDRSETWRVSVSHNYRRGRRSCDDDDDSSVSIEDEELSRLSGADLSSRPVTPRQPCLSVN